MTTKLRDSDIQFICEMGEFIGNHIPQIVDLIGKDTVKQLTDIWNETKTN